MIRTSPLAREDAPGRASARASKATRASTTTDGLRPLRPARRGQPRLVRRLRADALGVLPLRVRARRRPGHALRDGACPSRPDWVGPPEEDDHMRCRVCGLRQAEPPWGRDGASPTFDFCPCCGIEFGYHDASVEGARRARRAWLERGAPVGRARCAAGRLARLAAACARAERVARSAAGRAAVQVGQRVQRPDVWWCSRGAKGRAVRWRRGPATRVRLRRARGASWPPVTRPRLSTDRVVASGRRGSVVYIVGDGYVVRARSITG